MNTPGIPFLLRFLLGFYFPFLLFLCGTMAVMIVHLIVGGLWRPLAFLLAGLLALTIVQVVQAFLILRQRSPETNYLELSPPREGIESLYQLVTDIAREHSIRPPHEIRIAADTIAHVYEDDHGRRILVFGAQALAVFPQKALAGVIAHELAHFAAGDTHLTRWGQKRFVVMSMLEYHFASRRGTLLNPVVWLVRGYHLLYCLVWAVHSRRQEFAADQRQVALVGKATAGAALIQVSVTERLPWVRLSAIARAVVASKEPMDQIFAEHAQRARMVQSHEWEDACRKELRRKTAMFDSHPCLKERLKAMGISPKKALKRAMDLSGTPARDLIADWPALERELTQRLIDLYRLDYAQRMEMAQIIAGRPLGRP
jgi:Zn-dependent protease with chaperone function